MTDTPRHLAAFVVTDVDECCTSCREYDRYGRLIYFRAPDGYEEWYNPDAPSGQQTIRASAWDGCHDITHSQEG